MWRMTFGFFQKRGIRGAWDSGGTEGSVPNLGSDALRGKTWTLPLMSGTVGPECKYGTSDGGSQPASSCPLF